MRSAQRNRYFRELARIFRRDVDLRRLDASLRLDDPGGKRLAAQSGDQFAKRLGVRRWDESVAYAVSSVVNCHGKRARAHNQGNRHHTLHRVPLVFDVWLKLNRKTVAIE